MKLSEVFHDVVDRTFVDGVVNWSGKSNCDCWWAKCAKCKVAQLGSYLLLMVLVYCKYFLCMPFCAKLYRRLLHFTVVFFHFSNPLGNERQAFFVH
jgi:hypothetical protein